MQARAHVLGGVTAGTAVAVYTDYDPLLSFGAAIVGSLLPDIDHGKSKIANSNSIMRLLSFVVTLLFTHRTFTHSLVFMALIWFLLRSMPDVAFGFLAGMASHLLLDAMTKNGIKLFWPLPVTFRIPFYIRTGGAVERVVEIALCVINIYLLLNLFGLK